VKKSVTSVKHLTCLAAQVADVTMPTQTTHILSESTEQADKHKPHF